MQWGQRSETKASVGGAKNLFNVVIRGWQNTFIESWSRLMVEQQLCHMFQDREMRGLDLGFFDC